MIGMILCEIIYKSRNGIVEQFDTSSEAGEDKEMLKKRAGQEFREFCKEMGITTDCVLGCRFWKYSETQGESA